MNRSVSPLADKPAPKSLLLDLGRLERHQRLADGSIITPSHNPPEDGGLKYNPWLTR